MWCRLINAHLPFYFWAERQWRLFLKSKLAKQQWCAVNKWPLVKEIRFVNHLFLPVTINLHKNYQGNISVESWRTRCAKILHVIKQRSMSVPLQTSANRTSVLLIRWPNCHFIFLVSLRDSETLGHHDVYYLFSRHKQIQRVICEMTTCTFIRLPTPQTENS